MKDGHRGRGLSYEWLAICSRALSFASSCLCLTPRHGRDAGNRPSTAKHRFEQRFSRHICWGCRILLPTWRLAWSIWTCQFCRSKTAINCATWLNLHKNPWWLGKWTSTECDDKRGKMTQIQSLDKCRLNGSHVTKGQLWRYLLERLEFSEDS